MVRFLKREHTQLLMWHKILLFCESHWHSGYIDMFSFQLFPNVICKNTDIRGHTVTMATLIWILSSVNSQMVFNMSTICDFFHQDCINMAFPVWVLWYILRDCFIVKAFTLAAFIYIWLLHSVNSLMYFKTHFYCKSFITLATFIWLLHNVSYLILLKWTPRNH